MFRDKIDPCVLWSWSWSDWAPRTQNVVDVCLFFFCMQEQHFLTKICFVSPSGFGRKNLKATHLACRCFAAEFWSMLNRRSDSWTHASHTSWKDCIFQMTALFHRDWTLKKKEMDNAKFNLSQMFRLHCSFICFETNLLFSRICFLHNRLWHALFHLFFGTSPWHGLTSWWKQLNNENPTAVFSKTRQRAPWKQWYSLGPSFWQESLSLRWHCCWSPMTPPKRQLSQRRSLWNPSEHFINVFQASSKKICPLWANLIFHSFAVTVPRRRKNPHWTSGENKCERKWGTRNIVWEHVPWTWEGFCSLRWALTFSTDLIWFILLWRTFQNLFVAPRRWTFHLCKNGNNETQSVFKNCGTYDFSSFSNANAELDNVDVREAQNVFSVSELGQAIPFSQYTNEQWVAILMNTFICSGFVVFMACFQQGVLAAEHVLPTSLHFPQYSQEWK